MSSYYNEFDPAAAQWLRNLIKAGHIPAGDVDERSICDVGADDLVGYTQCHFFAGIGGWALAGRIAGWPDDREIWTGSCPCQPFSVAGKGAGAADSRHLWPNFFRLISARRPTVVMGEQVAAAVGKDWFNGVRTDLESIGYVGRGVVVPACAVNAPHRRDRLWFVANASGAGLEEREGVAGIRRGTDGAQSREDAANHGFAGDSESKRRNGRQDTTRENGWTGAEAAGCDVADRNSPKWRSDVAGRNDAKRDQAGWQQNTGDIAERGAGALEYSNGSCSGKERQQRSGEFLRLGGYTQGGAWDNSAWIIGHDGKARRVGARVRRLADGIPAGMAGLRTGQAGAEIQEEIEMIPLLAHGVRGRVAKLKGFGNAIVPQVAAEVISAWMECYP